MSRIRTVKPEFWKHEELSALPEAVHMLAASLLNYADDEGYFNANPKLVQAECCPLREPSVSVHDALTMLSKIGYLALGTGDDGKRYGRVVNFEQHQRINRKTHSKIKKIEIVWDDSVSAHTQLTEVLPLEGKGRERKGTTTGADAPDTGYAFEGKVVKLRRKSLSDWVKAFPNLDLIGELTARDAWLASDRATDADRARWFQSTSQHLANRNMTAKAKVVAMRPDGEPMTAAQRYTRETGII